MLVYYQDDLKAPLHGPHIIPRNPSSQIRAPCKVTLTTHNSSPLPTQSASYSMSSPFSSLFESTNPSFKIQSNFTSFGIFHHFSSEFIFFLLSVHPDFLIPCHIVFVYICLFAKFELLEGRILPCTFNTIPKT